jgi:micrococcal nuclease
MARLFGPARPPGPIARFVRRLVSVRGLFRVVMAVVVVGLIVIPLVADLVNAATKTVLAEGGGTCRILRVVDGDTVTLMCPEEGVQSARLVGFDTPEKYSPKCVSEFVAAERASWELRTLIQKAERLRVTREGVDRYGRALVRLELDGQDVAGRMVRTGLARVNNGGPRGSWC